MKDLKSMIGDVWEIHVDTWECVIYYWLEDSFEEWISHCHYNIWDTPVICIDVLWGDIWILVNNQLICDIWTDKKDLLNSYDDMVEIVEWLGKHMKSKYPWSK